MTQEDRIVCNDSLELRKLKRRFPSKTRHPFQVLQGPYFCFKLHSKGLLYEKVKKYFLSYKPSVPLNMSRTCSFGSGNVDTGRCNYCTVFRVRLMCWVAEPVRTVSLFPIASPQFPVPETESRGHHDRARHSLTRSSSTNVGTLHTNLTVDVVTATPRHGLPSLLLLLQHELRQTRCTGPRPLYIGPLAIGLEMK